MSIYLSISHNITDHPHIELGIIKSQASHPEFAEELNQSKLQYRERVTKT